MDLGISGSTEPAAKEFADLAELAGRGASAERSISERPAMGNALAAGREGDGETGLLRDILLQALDDYPARYRTTIKAAPAMQWLLAQPGFQKLQEIVDQESRNPGSRYASNHAWFELVQAVALALCWRRQQSAKSSVRPTSGQLLAAARKFRGLLRRGVAHPNRLTDQLDIYIEAAQGGAARKRSHRMDSQFANREAVRLFREGIIFTFGEDRPKMLQAFGSIVDYQGETLDKQNKRWRKEGRARAK